MAELMFACPNKGHAVPTGIQVSAATFDKMPAHRKLTQCPHCRMLHAWMTSEAWLKATDAEIAQASAESDKLGAATKLDDAGVKQWVID